MFKLNFPNSGYVSTILCLGAHSDDIEIGCGGTILRLLQERDDLAIWWVVFAATKQRRAEAEESSRLFLEGACGKTVVLHEYRDGFLPFLGEKIKECFEDLKDRVNPDLILTHFRQDLHQDHRIISELTWNTFRNHLILEYEIAKYDGDLASPNFFVHLNRQTCEKKVRYITDCFGTQRNRQWFTPDTFLALLRLRGLESNAPGRYAEAFYCRKMVY